MSSLFRDAVRVHEGQSTWTVIVRATLSTVLPLVTLLAIGRPEWTPYAAFGAFTALYGRALPVPQRLRAQVEVGLTQVLMIGLGTLVALSEYRSWIIIGVAAVVCSVMAFISHQRNWHPPGVMFQAFALCACASIPATGARVGSAVAVAAVTAAFCVGLTWIMSAGRHVAWAGSLGALRGREHPEPDPALLPGSVPRWRLRHYLLRYGVAVAAAGLLATALGIGHPYWAMVSAVVPMAAPTASARVVRGVQRVVGTFLGVGIAAAVLMLSPPPLVVIGIVAVGMVGAELFVTRNYIIAMLFITPLALSMVQLGHPLPITQLIADRALETALGIAVALVMTLLTRERR